MRIFFTTLVICENVLDMAEIIIIKIDNCPITYVAIFSGLLETLQANNQLLDQIMKCLEAYLESKRCVFPRSVPNYYLHYYMLPQI